MSFFDSKEEVFDVQLTQFGKKLLAMGVFRPTFYAFFDDDILYNAQKAGFSEKQNQTESRIIKDTPKLKTQHLTTGVVTSFADLEIFDTPGDVARLIIPGRDEPDEDDMPQCSSGATGLLGCISWELFWSLSLLLLLTTASLLQYSFITLSYCLSILTNAYYGLLQLL